MSSEFLSFRFGKDAKVVHFLGATKPWHHFCNPETSQVHIQDERSNVEGTREFTQMWWDMYNLFRNAPKSAPAQTEVIIL